MAVDQLIKQGDQYVADKDYLTGISSYTKALKENPKAFQALLKRSIAYQRFKNFVRAKTDVSEAFTIAEERGKRSEIADCYYRLGMIFYAEKDVEPAYKNFMKAKEFDCKEPALATWLLKCEGDLKTSKQTVGDSKGGSSKDESSEDAPKAATNDAPKSEPIKGKESKSTSIGEIEKHAPLKVKIREDWYQTNDEVIITIYAKNIKQEDFSIEYGEKSVNVSFPSGPGSEYNYNLDPLYASIIDNECSFKIYGTKIEIYLKKKEPYQWKSLEGSDNNSSDNIIHTTTTDTPGASLTYPTSSKKSINWSNFKVDDDDQANQDENAFFSQLFKDTDEDSRRAMMKSYVQSNGTVLTTNWDEAKEKTFETSPPEGMEARKW